jgi:hypothetical protein
LYPRQIFKFVDIFITVHSANTLLSMSKKLAHTLISPSRRLHSPKNTPKKSPLSPKNENVPKNESKVEPTSPLLPGKENQQSPPAKRGYVTHLLHLTVPYVFNRRRKLLANNQKDVKVVIDVPEDDSDTLVCVQLAYFMSMC